MEKLEANVGDYYERDGSLYKVIGCAYDKMIISVPAHEPRCDKCGNKFFEHDVESSSNFQEIAKPIKTIK